MYQVNDDAPSKTYRVSQIKIHLKTVFHLGILIRTEQIKVVNGIHVNEHEGHQANLKLVDKA